MKYEIHVQVDLRPKDPNYHYAGGEIRLSETQFVELATLSDAALVLVKLHEFFEALKTKGEK